MSERERVGRATYEVSPALTDCADTLEGIAAAQPIPWEGLHELDRAGWRCRADAAITATDARTVVEAFLEWFDARYPPSTKSNDLPGLTLYSIARKARELVK